MTMHTLRAFLDYMAERFDTADAYRWLEGDAIASKSFTELRDDASGVASKLFGLYGSGRKMALIGDMSYPWICAYYGIMNSSNISVPLDTKLNPSELAERLADQDMGPDVWQLDPAPGRMNLDGEWFFHVLAREVPSGSRVLYHYLLTLDGSGLFCIPAEGTGLGLTHEDLYRQEPEILKTEDFSDGVLIYHVK